MASSLPVGLSKKRVVLAVTGSIAAYKSALILRSLVQAGAEVRVLMTEAASHFIGRSTFTGLGAQVFSEMWNEPGESHVSLASWADCILVAPATANTMASLAEGRADNLLSATILCCDKPICMAPAMHPTMWAAPATQQNARTLFERGVHFIGPVEGEVASGDVGLGRLEEPARILAGLERALRGPADLDGRHVVITAGPTREAIDPVRAITNLSSGKMGYALAAEAAARGAHVTLISGPVELTPPAGVTPIFVESAVEMQAAIDRALGPALDLADALVMAAAVSDYRPQVTSTAKLKRSGEPLTLTLTPNPDILASVGQRRATLRPVLVGFALETSNGDALIGLGRKKLIQKRVDLIVANDQSALLGDESQVMLIAPVDCTPLPTMSKTETARHIVNWLKGRLAEPATQELTQ